jgi:hypothetical protein
MLRFSVLMVPPGSWSHRSFISSCGHTNSRGFIGVAACADAGVLPHKFQRVVDGPTQEYYPNMKTVVLKGIGGV